MDSSAIQEIAKQEATQVANTALKYWEPDQPLVAVPEGFAIRSLEQYMMGRTRYRGIMKTPSLDSFVEYCRAFDQDGAECHVDPDKLTATTIFNLGDLGEPGHADFKALLSLRKTAEFQALLDADGERFNQKQFAEWLEDWRDCITPYDKDGAELSAAQAIAGIRKMTVDASRKSDHEVGDYRASRSSLEEIEVKSQSAPGELVFRCYPYLDLRQRDFSIRISVLTGDNRLAFVPRVKRLQSAFQAMGEELREQLDQAFGESQIETYLGSFEP